MSLFSRMILKLLTTLANTLELCLRDYEQGGFLPPEKRGIVLHKQQHAAHLARLAARLKTLDSNPPLRTRLLLYASVLNNKYPSRTLK